jgi:Zn-dependent protease
VPGKSVKIGRLAGIPIGVSPLWLMIVGFITWSLGATYYPDQVSGISPAAAYSLGLASALLLFGSILLHELGHALVARRRGVGIEGIDLWLLGGVAKLRGEPRRAADELRYASAGPVVTVAIAALFGLLALALPATAPVAVVALVRYQLMINIVILAFNLLPAFPLDGGRILRAVLWSRTNDPARATYFATTIGRVFAYGFIGLGLIAALGGAFGGLWLVVIGGFLLLAASAEARHQRLLGALGGHTAGELMAYPAVIIPADLTAEEAVGAFARHRYRAFPVLTDDAVVGILSIDRLESLPPERRKITRVRELADSDPDLFVDERADVTEVLERPGFQRIGRAVVRTRRGGIGLLSITAVKRALRAIELKSTRPGPIVPVGR